MKKLMVLLLLLMVSTTCLLAQTKSKQIKGKVTDESGVGLEGASVKLIGTIRGVQSDNTGNFIIAVPTDGKKYELSISYIGFAAQTVPVTDNGTITTVKLQKQVGSSEDVVVIGYGTTKRKDLTGTVSSISGAELSKIPVSSAAEAITGRMPGVQVTTVDGQPGAEVVIRVRGGGSVTQDNSPLYIVDGFPVSSINDIAPQDIASIDILKDASSAAIYGAKGANGVVIITTKSPKGGRTVVSLNSYAQERTLPKELNVLSPYEFVLAQH